jgi:hypothetical protein
MSNDDHRPTSDFPEEKLTPVRRRSESQALIRLQQENTGPVDPIDGPEVEPLVNLQVSTPATRLRWLPWLIIGLLLALGVGLWVRHLGTGKRASGPVTAPDKAAQDDEGE